jgi:hypothetical protein
MTAIVSADHATLRRLPKTDDWPPLEAMVINREAAGGRWMAGTRETPERREGWAILNELLSSIHLIL